MSVSHSDHFDLSRLVEQYCDGVIRRDRDTWAATWADDDDLPGDDAAVWQLTGDPIHGKEAIVTYWVEAMERFEWVVQIAPHSVFDVADGADRGTGYVVAQERFKRADGHLGHLLAIYHDAYVRTADGWRFADRRLEIRDFG